MPTNLILINDRDTRNITGGQAHSTKYDIMKKLIIFILTTIVILTIYFFSLNVTEKKILIFDKLGFNRQFTWFYIGEMNANKDRLIYDEEITIWGYLIKQKNKFYLIQDKNFANIHFLKQPNLVILLSKDNKASNLEIDDHCLGHYVEVKGKLGKWSGLYTLSVEIMLGMEIDFDFACTPTYMNGKLHKQKWDE